MLASDTLLWGPSGELGLKAAVGGNEAVHKVLSYCEPSSRDAFALVCQWHLLAHVYHTLGGTTTASGPGMAALLRDPPAGLLQQALQLMGPVPSIFLPTYAHNTCPGVHVTGDCSSLFFHMPMS